MSAPKICIFTETFYPVVGGGETQAQLLAEGLLANGFPVILLTRRSNSSLKRFERFGDLHVYRLSPVGGGHFKKWGLIISSIPMLVKLRRRYDLIFVSGFRIVGISAVLISRLFRKSCVLKADSLGEMSGAFFESGLGKYGLSPSWFPFRLFLDFRNMILRRADAFTAISSGIAEELAAGGIDSAAIRMVPNSVDTDRFCPVDDHRKSELRQKLALPQTVKVIVYTGRLVSYKGLPLLLKVWLDIHREFDDALLLMVGTGGLDIHNCEAELKRYVSTHELEGSVRFTGSVRNVPEYLQASDIFVFPTENDAFPSSLIEAMTCKLPVVTTPIGAIDTIIADKHNGLVVQPGDHQQLHDALQRLLKDTGLATRLGQAGWQTVQDSYSAAIVSQKYIELFHEVVQTSSVTSPTDNS